MPSFRDQYNTPIPAEKYTDFMRWSEQESARRGRNIMADMEDYDVQGFWLNGDWKKQGIGGHATDKWKKPNHPTFSTESIYHNQNGYKGGTWKIKNGKTFYTPSQTNIQFYGKQGLFNYFREVEPDSILVID